MARKKRRSPARAPSAAARDSWIACTGYQLDQRNSPSAFVFELNVTGDDNNEYYLRVKQLNDRTGLIQRTLRLLAERWPAYDWYFQADSDGSIIDVR
jgi:hypothetical protein